MEIGGEHVDRRTEVNRRELEQGSVRIEITSCQRAVHAIEPAEERVAVCASHCNSIPTGLTIDLLKMLFKLVPVLERIHCDLEFVIEGGRGTARTGSG